MRLCNSACPHTHDIHHPLWTLVLPSLGIRAEQYSRPIEAGTGSPTIHDLLFYLLATVSGGRGGPASAEQRRPGRAQQEMQANVSAGGPGSTIMSRGRIARVGIACPCRMPTSSGGALGAARGRAWNQGAHARSHVRSEARVATPQTEHSKVYPCDRVCAGILLAICAGYVRDMCGDMCVTCAEHSVKAGLGTRDCARTCRLSRWYVRACAGNM